MFGDVVRMHIYNTHYIGRLTEILVLLTLTYGTKIIIVLCLNFYSIMDYGPRTGIVPSEEFIGEVGLFHADETLAPLRKLLGISTEEKHNFLIIPKLNPKTKSKDEPKRNVNVSDFTVVSRNAKKRGYIEKPEFNSSIPIPLLLSKKRDRQVSHSKTDTPKFSPARVIETPASVVIKPAVTIKKEPIVGIEPFIKSARISQPNPDVETAKKSSVDITQECPDNIMQNLALLRNFMSKIKADPHQAIEKCKFTPFNTEIHELPNKNCSTTAKVFCTDFAKNNRRVPEIHFKYYEGN